MVPPMEGRDESVLGFRSFLKLAKKCKNKSQPRTRAESSFKYSSRKGRMMTTNTKPITDSSDINANELPREIERWRDSELLRVCARAKSKNWPEAALKRAQRIVYQQTDLKVRQARLEARERLIQIKIRQAEQSAARRADAHSKIVLGGLLLKLVGSDLIKTTGGKIDSEATQTALRIALGLPAVSKQSPFGVRDNGGRQS